MNSNPYFPREKVVIGFQDKSIIIYGPHRSGKSVYISHSILHNIYPFWFRLLFPPIGFFLVGDQRFKTTVDWLKTQISSNDKEDPIAALMDLIKQRASDQVITRFISTIFPSCHRIFQPQPCVVIIDQAEELIRHHRADFMNTIFPLVKLCKDSPNALQLIIVVNSSNAVASLESLNGVNLFEIIQCPRPLSSVVANYKSSEYCSNFEKLDRCVGITNDYMSKKRVDNLDTPEEYLLRRIASYIQGNGVKNIVTKRELELFTDPSETISDTEVKS